jgi:hypothetical protein
MHSKSLVSRLSRVRLGTCTSVALVAVALSACGAESQATDTATEATQRNRVALGTMTYRVVRFRELNPEIAADRALLRSADIPDDRGLFAAFIEVCNHGDRPATPTDAIFLEDAFGEDSYPALRDGLDGSLAYAPVEIAPGDCLPAPDTVAERTFDGLAVVFAAPFEITQERPAILELRAGDDVARMELDL